MGLDDFTGESLSDEEKNRRKELSQNSPPSDETKWSSHEPGTPDWLSFISGDVKDPEKIPDVEQGDDKLDGDKVLAISIQGVITTEYRSTSYVKLENCR